MDKNKCWGICNETERLENVIDTLENELETYKMAFYMACNGKEYLVKDFLQRARERNEW